MGKYWNIWLVICHIYPNFERREKKLQNDTKYYNENIAGEELEVGI